MRKTGFIWECACGHQEYGEEAPEECNKCHQLDNFLKLPEEIIEEREKEKSDLDLIEKNSRKRKKKI